MAVKQHVTYFDNFQVKSYTETFNGVKTHSKEFYPNGKMKCQSSFISGVLDKHYELNENGDMVFFIEGKRWKRWKYNKKGWKVLYEDSNGHWDKHTYNKKGYKIRTDTSSGMWVKYKYNKGGELIKTTNSVNSNE